MLLPRFGNEHACGAIQEGNCGGRSFLGRSSTEHELLRQVGIPSFGSSHCVSRMYTATAMSIASQVLIIYSDYYTKGNLDQPPPELNRKGRGCRIVVTALRPQFCEERFGRNLRFAPEIVGICALLKRN